MTMPWRHAHGLSWLNQSAPPQKFFEPRVSYRRPTLGMRVMP